MSSNQIVLSHDRYFLNWLQEHHLSIAMSTYQSNRLLLLGIKESPSIRLGLFERFFERPMGLYVEDEQAFWLSTRYQLWRFVNSLQPGQRYEEGDKLYIPRQSWVTGDLDIHDLVITANGQPVFVSTAFNALGTTSATHNAKLLWKPSFISQWVAEDRCHLNGLALRDGEPRYATAVSTSDGIDGWREHRATGGIIIDVQNDEIIARGLSMPHSPRFYRNKLWLLNSGTGEFGFVDETSGHFEAVAFCPGYARGLIFYKQFAIIGLSQARDASFAGLALDEQLQRRQLAARCGLVIIDLDSGTCVHWVRLEGIISELYDVQIIPNATRPLALGFKADTIATHIVLEPN